MWVIPVSDSRSHKELLSIVGMAFEHYDIAVANPSHLAESVVTALIRELNFQVELSVSGMEVRGPGGRVVWVRSSEYPEEMSSEVEELAEIRGGEIEYRLISDWVLDYRW